MRICIGWIIKFSKISRISGWITMNLLNFQYILWRHFLVWNAKRGGYGSGAQIWKSGLGNGRLSFFNFVLMNGNRTKVPWNVYVQVIKDVTYSIAGPDQFEQVCRYQQLSLIVAYIAVLRNVYFQWTRPFQNVLDPTEHHTWMKISKKGSLDLLL